MPKHTQHLKVKQGSWDNRHNIQYINYYHTEVSGSVDATRGILVVTKLKFSSNGEVRRKIPYHLPRPETTHTSVLLQGLNSTASPNAMLGADAEHFRQKSTVHGSLLQVNCLFPQDLPSKHTTYHTTFPFVKPGKVSVENRKTAQ